MQRRLRAVSALSSAAAVGVLVLSGCSSDSSGGPADYRPSPGKSDIEGGPGVQISPILPLPSLSGPDGGGGGGGSSSSSPNGKKQDPLVVATKLTTPVGLTMLPDNTALVGERTTGRIVRVQPVAGKPVPTVRTLPGVDGSGDGGLLDLALSPTYDEDSLIYAYLTTSTDNRVVAFTLDGPVTPVITGIPRGRTGNTGRLEFSPTGTLLVGTGNAGRASVPSTSLAGKVLNINDIGTPAAGNPKPSSPVYASGLRQSDGLCAIPKTTTVLQVEATASGRGEINSITRGGSYASKAPLASVPIATGAPGGCAVLNNRLYVASLDGTELLSAPLTGTGAKLKVGKFVDLLKKTYGRLRTVVPADDGALWLTTSNRDGKGKPVADDERVIRYVPDANGGGGNPA